MEGGAKVSPAAGWLLLAEWVELWAVGEGRVTNP